MQTGKLTINFLQNMEMNFVDLQHYFFSYQVALWWWM